MSEGRAVVSACPFAMENAGRLLSGRAARCFTTEKANVIEMVRPVDIAGRPELIRELEGTPLRA